MLLGFKSLIIGHMERVGDPKTVEELTREFFNRPARVVAADIAEKWYSDGEEPRLAIPGRPTILTVANQGNTREFRIKLAQAFSAEKPGKIWKGKVLEELRGLDLGTIVVYRRRIGLIPFLVAQDGDNIALRGIEDIETGEQFTSGIQVATALGLEANQKGKLIYGGFDRFNFSRVA